MKSITVKKKGEKLLRLDLSYSIKINSLKITGDFFLYPEDKIDEIENFFLEKNLEEISRASFDKFIEKAQIKLYGISTDTIIDNIKHLIEQDLLDMGNEK